MAKTTSKSTKSQSKATSPGLKKKSIKKSNGKTLKLKPTSAKKSPSNVIVKTISIHKDQKDWFKLNNGLMNLGFGTRAIHAGFNPDPLHGGVAPSIEMSTTYAQPAPGVPSSAFDYSRCGNPTVLAFQRNLAALEGGKYAFALNTGMSATVSVMSLLKQGDHFLCIDDVYGGTQRYIRQVFSPMTNIDWDMIDFSDLKKVRAAFKPNTKIVWIETPTNPTLKCTDIAGVAKICKEKGAMLVVDNTFMSPVLQNPLALGADIVMHSVTKYIGGHSDVLGGALIFNDSALYDKLYLHVKSIGTCMNAFEAWVALRGAKTLKLRVEKAADNALAIAKYLEAHPKVERVLYPGLKSHPHHAIAKKNRSSDKYSGGSGMLSFYIKGDIKAANKLLSSYKVFTLAESLGAVESLIESPAIMTHGSVPPAHRKMLGIDDNFIRVSVGCEDIEDLIADMEAAFKKI